MNGPIQRLWMVVARHSLMLALGFAMTLFVVSPNIRSWNTIGSENFRGVYPVFTDDEITYQARIKEVTEGKYSIGNPYIKEHMDDAFIMPPIAELIMACGVWLTGASVPFIAAFGDFVIVFIDFILIYTFFLIVSGGYRTIALLYTVIFVVCILASLGRPISPQLNYVFLFAGLIPIALIYFRESIYSRRWHVSAGLITGITCFISPYFFTTLFVLYSSLYLAKVCINKKSRLFTQDLLYFSVSFFPFLLVFLYFQHKASQGISYAETALRYGIMYTHLPGSFTNVALAVLAGGVIVLASRKLSLQERFFCMSGVITIFILNWQNIITGVSLQFAPHYQFTTIPIIFSVLMIIHQRLITNNEVGRISSKIIGVALLLLMCIIVYHQRNEFMHIARMPYSEVELVAMQKKMDVFSWLRTNTQSDSVVYSLGGMYDFTLPVYTENKVYYNFYIALYPASDHEVENRWLAQHLFDLNMSSSTIQEAHREYWGNRYIDSYASAENRKKIIALVTLNEYVPGERISDSLSERMYSRWIDVKSQPPIDVLRQYEIDYILLSKEYQYYDETKKRLEQIDELSIVADFNGELLYALQK